MREPIGAPGWRLCRKSHAAPPLRSNLGHRLTDNRHRLAANVQASPSDGPVEGGLGARKLADVAGPSRHAHPCTSTVDRQTHAIRL
jgi:hypothetical protein